MSAGLAKIHIARKETGIHEDDYRSMLMRLTGQETAKGLNDAQIGRVVEEFKRLGWNPTVVKGGKAGAPKAKAKPAEHPTARKARALWISLWQLGAIDDRSEKALEAFATRQLKDDQPLRELRANLSPAVAAWRPLLETELLVRAGRTADG